MISMNAMTQNIDFNFAAEPAFARLGPAEKAFVESFVADVEIYSVRSGQTLQEAARARALMISDQRSLDLLKIALVQVAIEDRLRGLADSFEMAEFKTIKSLTNIAHSTMKNFVRVDSLGDPHLDFSNATADDWDAVQSYKETETPNKIVREIKLHSKMDAIKVKMQYHGLLDGEKWRDLKNRASADARFKSDESLENVQDAYARFIADD